MQVNGNVKNSINFKNNFKYHCNDLFFFTPW